MMTPCGREGGALCAVVLAHVKHNLPAGHAAEPS
jgi:hypothetical protein